MCLILSLQIHPQEKQDAMNSQFDLFTLTAFFPFQ